MSDSSSIGAIETRIRELVHDYVGVNGTDAPITPALRPMFHTVVDQALASSEGGKRLRALLTLDAYDVLAGAPDSTQSRSVRTKVLDFACAIEVFQTAALVHDDLIDD